MSLKEKLLKNPQILAMAQQMFNSMGNDAQLKFAQNAGKDLGLLTKAGKLSSKASINNVNAGQLGSLALGAAKAHPFKTAGLIGLGAGNLGGLTDGNGIGGQVAGLGLGGLGAYALASNPYTAAMMTLGGGELGALFDKLRAQKEQEQQAQFYR